MNTTTTTGATTGVMTTVVRRLLRRLDDYTLWAFNPQPELGSRYDREV